MRRIFATIWRHLGFLVVAPSLQGPRLAAAAALTVGAVAAGGLNFKQTSCWMQPRGNCMVHVKSRQEHRKAGKDGIALLFAPSVASPGSFATFSMSHGVVPFMREVVRVIEEDFGLFSYHLRVEPIDSNGQLDSSEGWRRHETDEVQAILAQADAGTLAQASAISGFLIFAVGNPHGLSSKGKGSNEVPIVKGLSDLNAPINYEDASGNFISVENVTQGDVLAWEHDLDHLVRCGMDWQGRPCLVAVIAPAAPAAQRLGGAENVRRQTELSNEELFALWHTVGRAVHLHGGKFLNIRLNAGSYQNVAHLHVKIFFNKNVFNSQWADNPVFRKLLQARKARNNS